jgi:hypothetical protein
MMAKFPFNDLHSFKDYVGFVKLCAPDMFPEREGLAQEDQWTLGLAFEGLRDGMKLAIAEKGDRPVFRECCVLIEDAKSAYLLNNIREGYLKLDGVSNLLKKISTQ